MLKRSMKLRVYYYAVVWQHKYNFRQVQCKLPEDGRRPKHVGAIFMCTLM